MTLKHDFVETDVRQSRIRLTRAAVLVLMVLLFLGAALILNAWKKASTGQTALRPTIVVTLIPTAIPSPSPSPAPFVCPDDPANWIVRMKAGLTGQEIGEIDPPCVAEKALADFKNAVRWYYEEPDRNPADAALYFADDPLASLAELLSTTVSSLQGMGQGFQIVVNPEDRLTYIGGFSPDGKQVSVIDRYPNGCVFQTYDRETGKAATSENHPAHLMVFTMIYDATDHRWKIGKMEERELDSVGDPLLYQEVIEYLYGNSSIITPEGGK